MWKAGRGENIEKELGKLFGVQIHFSWCDKWVSNSQTPLYIMFDLCPSISTNS